MKFNIILVFGILIGLLIPILLNRLTMLRLNRMRRLNNKLEIKEWMGLTREERKSRYFDDQKQAMKKKKNLLEKIRREYKTISKKY